jgi:hypothetical protein
VQDFVYIVKVLSFNVDLKLITPWDFVENWAGVVSTIAAFVSHLKVGVV